MSVYGINKVCYQVQMDLNFRERLRHDPAGAIAGFPLSDEEREAFLSGDVASLYRLGAHSFLLSRLPRFDSLGLTRDEYIKRMRTLL
jgi:aromatic-ring opening dioxygenase LigAB LigA subunit